MCCPLCLSENIATPTFSSSNGGNDNNTTTNNNEGSNSTSNNYSDIDTNAHRTPVNDEDVTVV